MTLCNNAFIDLANHLEDILSSSFEESPRGDVSRIEKVGTNIIKLLTNSLYSVTWVNTKYANETSQTPLNSSDIKKVNESS